MIDTTTLVAPTNGLSMNKVTGALQIPANTLVGKFTQIVEIKFKMYSGTGSGTFGDHLLYDGVVKSKPITINVKCSQIAFDLNSIKKSPDGDLNVHALDDSSKLKFKMINVENKVPNCPITSFSLVDEQ